MSRSYTRTFSTNAEPSKANWDPDQPRTCGNCGRKCRITLDSLWMRRFPVRITFCGECTPKWRLVRGPQVYR